jgi:hypothetical protein
MTGPGVAGLALPSEDWPRTRPLPATIYPGGRPVVAGVTHSAGGDDSVTTGWYPTGLSPVWPPRTMFLTGSTLDRGFSDGRIVTCDVMSTR